MPKSFAQQIEDDENKIKRIREHQRMVRAKQAKKERNARTKRLVETAAIYEKATGYVAESDEDRAKLSRTLERPIRLADGTTVKLGTLIGRLCNQPEPPAQRAVQSTVAAPQPAHTQPQSFTPNPQRIEHRPDAQRRSRVF